MKSQKQELTEFYENYVTWKEWHSLFSFTEQDKRYFQKEFGPYLSSNSKTLEIGFGSGRFMGWARSANYNTTGLEILDELIGKARVEGFIAHNIEEYTPSKEFDLVIAISVLEHLTVDQLADTLHLISKSLKPSGVAICRVPNGLSPFGRVNQHGDITHIQTITPSCLQQIITMKQIPIQISDVRNPAMPIGWGRGPFYVIANIIRLVLRRALYKMLSAIVGIPQHLDTNLIIELRPIPHLKRS